MVGRFKRRSVRVISEVIRKIEIGRPGCKGWFGQMAIKYENMTRRPPI